MLHTITQRFLSAFSKFGPLENRSDILTYPVLLNSNEERIDPKLIEILLKTIFVSRPDTAKEFLPWLVTNPSVASIADAESEIERRLNTAVSKSLPDARQQLADFNAHKMRSNSNRMAYSTEGKAVPDAVFWPNPLSENNPRNLRTELPYVLHAPIIDSRTPIASAGSCFAVEIAYALQEKKFNYLVKEPNASPDGLYWFKDYASRPFATSSAAWGIHFNTPSFLQLVEKAFGLRRPAKILWTNRSSNGEIVYCDPFREEIEFPSIEAFDRNYEQHINAVRSVFLEAEVLIITLGLNEVWYFRPDGSVFSRSPWRTAPSLVEHCTLTVQENVDMLQRMLDILRMHNPKLKLIVTLSPVPLHATFLADSKHIIEANTHSKAVLRVAAEEFVRKNQNVVYYFPSFELITTCLENPWDADQRHVSSTAVERVMTMFYKMFVKQNQ